MGQIVFALVFLVVVAATGSAQAPSTGRSAKQLPLLFTPTSPASTSFASSAVSGRLSEWARNLKSQFLSELSDGCANEWIIVMGNEAGGQCQECQCKLPSANLTPSLLRQSDTDSMAAAIAWAYHLTHSGARSQKAISLLQTVEDALDLRPENQLALERASMGARHRDLLSSATFEALRYAIHQD